MLLSTVQLAWMRQFCVLNTVTIPVEIFRIYFVSASLRIRVIRPSDSSQPWHALPHSMDAGWLTYWNIPISNSKRESHPWWQSIQGIPAVVISQMNCLPCREDATIQEAPAFKTEIFPYPVSCYQNTVIEVSSARAVNSTVNSTAQESSPCKGKFWTQFTTRSGQQVLFPWVYSLQFTYFPGVTLPQGLLWKDNGVCCSWSHTELGQTEQLSYSMFQKSNDQDN